MTYEWLPSRRRCLALIGVGLAGLLAAEEAGAQENPREAPEQFHRYGIDQQTITVATRTGHYPFLVAVINNPGDPESALMARRRVQPDEGILYLTDYVQPLGISNLGVPFPTDLLFVAPDGRVIGVHPGIMANDSRTVTSSIPVKAALQVVAGTVARISAAPGDYLLNSVFGRTL